MEASLVAAAGYVELSALMAGSTFQNGLYRIHNSASGPAALEAIGEGFPEFTDRVRPFGFDWLGRQFALDLARVRGGEPLVLMFEPGTGEALEIPATLIEFHETELVDHGDAALAEPFFEEWSAGHRSELPIAFDQCVGYRQPLFLGGQDDLGNLELTDMEVYWSFCGQLRIQILGLAKGTPINRVSKLG
jgi:hypothetical protein